MSGKCDSCMVDGHDICWDTKPDQTCPCCLDTWFGILWAWQLRGRPVEVTP